MSHTRYNPDMKKMLMALVLVCLGVAAQARPYFRLIDPLHPAKVVGAFIDPVNPGNTSAGTAFALITHSPKDGCWLPSVGCVDWSPLMAGFSMNAGRAQFNVGPALNLTPAVKIGLWHALNLVTASETLTGVKSLLGSQPIGGPDVSASFGPALAVAPIERGILLPVNAWQPKFRIFAGAALHF